MALLSCPGEAKFLRGKPSMVSHQENTICVAGEDQQGSYRRNVFWPLHVLGT